MVVELGPEHLAAEAKIVIEAKQDKGFALPAALTELAEARKNREADVGVFVFSKQTAPQGLEPFARYGENIVVVWDAEDPATDVFLEAGLSIAKALSTRAKSHNEEVGGDINDIEVAITTVEGQIKELGDITTWTQTIKSNSEKILKRTERVQTNLMTQIEILNEKVEALSNILSE